MRVSNTRKSLPFAVKIKQKQARLCIFSTRTTIHVLTQALCRLTLFISLYLNKAGISFYDLFDPKINIQVGAYILATVLKNTKMPKDAINAYNGKINDNPYSAKVFKEFKKLYGSSTTGKQNFTIAIPHSSPKRYPTSLTITMAPSGSFLRKRLMSARIFMAACVFPLPHILFQFVKTDNTVTVFDEKV